MEIVEAPCDPGPVPASSAGGSGSERGPARDLRPWQATGVASRLRHVRKRTRRMKARHLPLGGGPFVPGGPVPMGWG